MSEAGASLAIRSSKEMGGASSSKIELDPDHNLRQLRKVYWRFKTSCRSCHRALPTPTDDCERHIEEWLAGAKAFPPTTQISLLQCTACRETTCVGCGGAPVLNKDNCVWTSLGMINNCCEDGRLFGIWLLLCRFEEEDARFNANASKPKPKPVLKDVRRKVHPAIAHNHQFLQAQQVLASKIGIAPSGITSGFASGVGYSSDPYDDETFDEEEFMNMHMYGYPRRSTPISSPVKDTMDPMLAITMKLLIGFLPRVKSDTSTVPSDDMCLFRTSILLDRVNDMARNDSITDIVERREAYDAMFDFVRSLTYHPCKSFSQLFLESRPERKLNPGLKALTSSSYISMSNGAFTPSWLSACENTYRQSRVFIEIVSKSEKPRGERSLAQKIRGSLRRDASPEPESIAPQNKDSIRICETVIQLYENLERGMTKINIKNELDHPAKWRQFMEENKVTFTDEVLKNHRCLNKQRGGDRQVGPSGRMNTIGKEIANMATSLPDGIFLKVAESRSDVMKVLMVGVEGTPYAGGLFSFDLLLGDNYPASPPIMSFVLENVDEDGQPMNPNLHVGGSVCLSLLNTWEGSPEQMWQPHKSTILSVLVSVQAMILGAPLPWLNEPGYERLGIDKEAIRHKLRIQCKTVKYAMIQWLKKKNDKANNDIWKDINAAYWEHNSDSVYETVQQWVKDNPDIVHYGPDEPIRHIPGGQHHAHSKLKKKGKDKSEEPKPKANLLKELSQLTYPDRVVIHNGQPGSSKRKFPIIDLISEGASSASPKRQRSEDEIVDLTKEPEHPYSLHSGSSYNSVFNSPHSDFNGSNSGFESSKSHTAYNLKSSKSAQSIDGMYHLGTDRWEYKGGHSMESVRAACAAFGVQPARSIADSVARLENDVNGKGRVEFDLAEQWGRIVPGEKGDGMSVGMVGMVGMGMGQGWLEGELDEADQAFNAY